jgi:hypothetical protein
LNLQIQDINTKQDVLIYFLKMSHKNLENYVSSKERACESVARISFLLLKYFPLDGIDETKPGDDDDLEGTDLFLFPNREFTDLTDCAVIRVQVKSSETGLKKFVENGKQFFGLSGEEWRDRKLIVLNGQWSETTIIADFVAQLANLRGILNNPFEMEVFLNALGEYPQTCYRHAINQGLLEQYRGELYRWVEPKPTKVS